MEKNKILRILYIAPEIPSLSTTFIYNEILALESRDFVIVPVSLHSSQLVNPTEKLKYLIEKTHILYQKKWLDLAKENLSFLSKKPISYLRVLITFLKDAIYVGIGSRKSFKLFYQFIHAAKVANIVRLQNCQHIHAHFATAPVPIAMYASMLASVPFTFTTHATDIFTEQYLLNRIAKRAKSVITISNYNRSFLLEKGLQPEHVNVVRCGINISNLNPTNTRSIGQVPKIATLCRLVEKKGVDVLIKALAILKEKGSDFTFEVAGDGPLKEALIDLASEHGLGSITKFEGAISHEHVFSWLKNVDIFVLACKTQQNGDQDGIPVALMEAMAIGTPVVSTRISGIPELIEDGVSGHLSEPDDPISLAEAISKILAKKEVISYMRKAAFKKIESEFSEDENIKRLICVFNSEK